MSTTRPPFYLLSVVANVERHKLASGEPWLMLMDVVYQDPATSLYEHIRLVRDLDPFTFDSGDGNGPQVYTPFNFQMGDLSVNSQGSVPETEVTASNVMRVLQTIIEQYSGLVGAQLYLYVVNATNPSGESELSLAFTVKQTVSDAKLVHFKLGQSSPLRRLFPLLMYRPNYCGWQFMGPQCGYVGTTFTGTIAVGSPNIINVPSLVGIGVGAFVTGPGIPAGATILGASGTEVTLVVPNPAGGNLPASMTASGDVTLHTVLATCSHTIDGATGCIAHDNLIRILSFPGIDSNGAAVASVI